MDGRSINLKHLTTFELCSNPRDWYSDFPKESRWPTEAIQLGLMHLAHGLYPTSKH